MMGTLDALRTWRERHPDGTGDDWRVAQGRGWHRDPDVIADARRMEVAGCVCHVVERGRVRPCAMHPTVPDNRDAVARVATIDPDLFIHRRPRGDRLVYVLLRELEQIDSLAATAGRTWYDANRETLTVDQGSDWITRIRAKIAEASVTTIPTSRFSVRTDAPPVTPPPAPPLQRSAQLWATWRQLAAELVEIGGRHGARFAVDTEDGATNTVAFWWIVPAKDGRFYLRQIIGGQGPVRVRISVDAMIAIANKIKNAGPYDAMIRFGRELGRCGHCGTELTNDESRARGIGPVCARKHG